MRKYLEHFNLSWRKEVFRKYFTLIVLHGPVPVSERDWGSVMDDKIILGGFSLKIIIRTQSSGLWRIYSPEWNALEYWPGFCTFSTDSSSHSSL